MADQGPAVPIPELAVQPLTEAEMKNIQGDILLGLPKKSQKFFFFKVVEVEEFRDRLSSVVPLITTCNQTHSDREAIRHRHNRSDCLHIGGINVAFSWEGLKTINPAIFQDSPQGQPAVVDPNFEAGMEAKRLSLRDDPENWNPANWTTWNGPKNAKGKPATRGFQGRHIHGVVLIVGEDGNKVQRLFGEVQRILDDSVQEVISLDGNTRPGVEEGHEHFGYKDGISQPFVRGIEEWTKKPELPGQGRVPPGVILLNREGDNEEAPGPADASTLPRLERPTWAHDGSFLAFRYLHQKRPEFDRFVKGTSTAQGVDASLLGARMVGRWKSGAPLDIADTADDGELASDENRNNDFKFIDNDNIGSNPHSRCPFAAHIRKTNPRNDLPASVMSMERILRRGIPYGPEVDDDEKLSQTTSHDRGLLFACYQSHISRGFDLMQKTWANNVKFIFNKTPIAGVDPIIGQTHKGDTPNEDKRRASGMISINTQHATNKEPDLLPMGNATDEWVVSRGGEYFFSPSITSLKRYIAL